MPELSPRNFVLIMMSVFVLGFIVSVTLQQHLGHPGISIVFQILTIIPISFVLGVMSMYFFAEKTKNVKIQSLTKILPQDEREIMRILVEKKETTQTDLRLRTGLSKVKITRIIDKLDKRGVVSKNRYGNTNLIKLKIKG